MRTILLLFILMIAGACSLKQAVQKREMAAQTATDLEVSNDTSLRYNHHKSQLPDDLNPLFDYWMRDTYVMLAPDGYYYLTGTTRTPGRYHVWDYNDGIRLWRSSDLNQWEPLGLVWSFEEDATWQKDFQPVPESDWEYHRKDARGVPVEPVRRSVWAPELHYVHGDYYLTASLNWVDNPDFEDRYATFLLKSSSGRPEGPYEEVSDGPMADWIDASLFIDTDGQVYYLWLDGRIVKMKPDMSGFDGPVRQLDQSLFEPEPYAEGVFLFKRDGKYHLLLTYCKKEQNGEAGYWPQGKLLSYDCVAASSDSLFGPYGERYTAISGGGHNNVFQDKKGQWWSTFFGNPRDAEKLPFVQKPGILKIEWDGDRFFPEY